MTIDTLDPAALDQLFRTARTHNKWQDRPVPDTKLQELYDLLKYGPTSANSSRPASSSSAPPRARPS